MPGPLDQARIAGAIRGILRTIYVENRKAFAAEAAARAIPLESLAAAAITGMLWEKLLPIVSPQQKSRRHSPYQGAAARLLGREKQRGAGP